MERHLRGPLLDRPAFMNITPRPHCHILDNHIRSIMDNHIRGIMDNHIRSIMDSRIRSIMDSLVRSIMVNRIWSIMDSRLAWGSLYSLMTELPLII